MNAQQPNPVMHQMVQGAEVNQQAVEDKAIQVIADPRQYATASGAVKALMLQPSERVAAAAMSSKGMAQNFAAIRNVVNQELGRQQVRAQHGAVLPLRVAEKMGTPDLPNLQQQAFGKLSQESALPTQPASGVLGWGQRLADEYEKTLSGIGPGLVQYAKGTYDHPIGEQEMVGKALAQSYGRSITHPIRNFKEDPFEFLMNVGTLPFFYARAAGTVTDIARASELAAAAGRSVPTQIGRTLAFGPERATRDIALSQNEGALRVAPPAYKSALGGLIQSKVLDPLLERSLGGGQGLLPKVADKISGISPGSRFGRLARKDMEDDIRIRAATLATRMPADQAVGIARGTAFADRWQALFHSGISGEEAAARNGKWVPIKNVPEDMPTKPGEFLTPKDLKGHSYLNLKSDRALANHFDTAAGRSKMIASQEWADANPDLVRYVPKDVLDSMKPYTPGVGPAAKALNTIDRGTQIIRSGRFATPAYAWWAIQNGALHAAQAGPLMARNAWDLRYAFPHASQALKDAIDAGTGKGVAYAQKGSQEAGGLNLAATLGQHVPQTLKDIHAKLPEFWHNLDDKWARRMSAIHELHAAGYHNVNDWEKLLKKDPVKFRTIMQGASHEAIDYAEMTPSERATFQKLFTAYGWTRGASTYAARFPFQHPVQARVNAQLSANANQTIDEYYRKLGGMAPTWLRSYMPFGGGHVMPTSWLNPAETLAQVAEAVPGLNQAQTENLESQLGPVPMAAAELGTGATPYGQSFRGNQRLTGPISAMLSRYKPAGVSEVLARSKKGGTFTQGNIPSLMRLTGVPWEQLRNPTQTAGLGQKDYEQALSVPDKIKFQYKTKMYDFPAQLAAYQKANNGQPLSGQEISKIKGDFDAVEQRDLFQHSFANAHGAKTWKALPPVNKFQGTLRWMADHGYNHAELAAAQHMEQTLGSDTDIEKLVNMMWKNTGIGHAEAVWKGVQKKIKPPSITQANP
jgi:hypothetical protein